MSLIKSESDNLEMITGIGPDVRKWLAESFDVRTFSALANLTIEDLTDRIKADKKPSIWQRWVKNWPLEAKQMMDETESNAQKSVDMINDDRYFTHVAEPSKKFSNPKSNYSAKGKNGWETLALYFVEFLTRKASGKPDELLTKVVFEGPGPQAEMPFPNIEIEGAVQWILEHANSILQDDSEMEKKQMPATMDQQIVPSPISISQVNLFQPIGINKPLVSFSRKRPQFSMISSNLPFAIEIFFEGSCPQNSKKNLDYINIQFNVKNLDTKKYTSLGTVEPKKVGDHKVFSAILPNICLQRGMYRLYVLVLSHPKLRLLDSVDIPFLKVY